LRRALCVLLLASCKHQPRDVELTQTYRVQSGLATAHFPKGVKPGQVNDLVAVLRPEAGGPLDLDDELYISTHPTPSTTVLDEYVRILHAPFENDMKGWKEEERKATSCLGVYSGIEIRATFLAGDGKMRRYWSCTFLRNMRGYKVSFVVPEAAAKNDEPLLREIAGATQITSP
jgi:hypothetical protein